MKLHYQTQATLFVLLLAALVVMILRDYPQITNSIVLFVFGAR
jgi:hypothetical protein